MKIEEIKKLSQEKWLPIIREKSAKFLCELVKKQRPRKILEIGTCFGYSGCLMLSQSEDAFLTTIDCDEFAVAQAKKTFFDEGFAARVNVICDDGYSVLESLYKNKLKFDLIFLDGPKGQYFKYLPLLKKILSIGGFLVADDVLFHGYVKQNGPVKHKHRTIVTNLRKFLLDLSNDSNFDFKLLEFEDGVAVAKKISE